MQSKKILIGIVALVLAIVFAFMFVIAPIHACAGHITFGDYYSKSTVSAVMLFLCSAIASCCIFNKLGKKTLHSTASTVIIGLLGLLVAGLVNYIIGRNTANSILYCDLAEIIKNAVISAVATLVSGFVSGFGMTIFDFNKHNSKEDIVYSVEQVNSNNAPVSKIVGALLGFLFGGLGVHRYYLGYRKQGVIQTCGFISLVIAYSYYITHSIHGRATTLVGSIFMLFLALYGVATSIWAFVDFIRILTGGLQPANGNTYSENRPQQVQIVQPKETASDTADAIAKLAKLHEQGILTDEEFQKKKAELLAKM